MALSRAVTHRVLFIVLGVACLSWAAVRGLDRLAFVRAASSADGTIVAHMPRAGPKVTFQTASGGMASFILIEYPYFWPAWPLYFRDRDNHLGAHVHVLYLPADPDETAVRDDFQPLWGLAAFLAMSGVVFIVIGVLERTGRWRR